MNDNYLFPKWLLNYPISEESKLTYMYLYNLLQSSEHEYIKITVVEIENALNLTQFKRRKVMNELKSKRLILRTNKGKNTKTYVLAPNDKEGL